MKRAGGPRPRRAPRPLLRRHRHGVDGAREGRARAGHRKCRDHPRTTCSVSPHTGELLPGEHRGYVYRGGSDGRFAFPEGFSNRRAWASVLADVIEGDGGTVELVSFSRGIVRTRRWTDGAASADVATATLTVETETGLVCSQATAGLFDGDAHVDLVARCIPRASSAEDWGLQVFTGRGENADSTEFELVESEIAEIEAAFPR